MTIDVRAFLREFASFKAKARKGGTVRICDTEGEFLFTAAGARTTLLEAARVLAVTPYEQLAISDVTLQETGLRLHSGKITFSGSPVSVLNGLLD